jgi:outer membrane protein TolC
MKYFSAILVCFVTAMGAAVGYSETLSLDVEKAVEISLQNNLNLKSEKIDLGIRARAKDTAWNAYLPGLSISTASSYVSETERLANLIPGSSRWFISAGFTANLDLIGTKKNGIRNTLLEYEAGRISLEDVEKQLIRDVKKSYYYLILIEEGMKILYETIDTAQKRYEQALINYENGLVSELTVLNALVTLENIKPDLEDARVTYRTEELQFRQLLGIEEDVEMNLQGTINLSEVDLDMNSLIGRYTERNLSVQSLRKSIQLLDNQKKLAKSEGFAPVLSLSSALTTSLQDPIRSNITSGADWRDGFTFRVGLSLPLDGLLPSSKSRVSVQAIEDSIDSAHVQLAETLQRVAVEVETSILNMEKSLKTMRSLEENVTLAQKVYDLTEIEYNAGVTDLLQLEDANDKLLDAKLAVLEQKYNYLSYFFDLEYVLNTSLTERI